MQETQLVSPETAVAKPKDKKKRTIPWWDKVIALVAVANLLLALFNITYIPLRDYYLFEFPGFVQTYDRIKGIEPHPFTERYLRTVDQLEANYFQPEASGEKIEELLGSLRQQSLEMLDNNPFLVASKFKTFARVQRVIRQHMNEEYAETAFAKFWTLNHLEEVGWQNEIAFFESYLRPLIASNYFRNVDDFGQYIDEFWRVDVFFIAFFAIEYLTRSFIISLRQSETNIFDAMLRRWYEIFLLLPFWRWLRILPVGVKIHTSKLINLERIISQITHEPAAYLADRVSQFLLVRLVNQAKDSVAEGDFSRSLLYPQPYLTVNDVDEVEAIVDRLLQLTIYKVLPKVQPDLEALLHHSLLRSFQDSDFYATLHKVPGVGNLSDELIETLSTQLAEASVNVLASSYADTEGREIFDKLSSDFSHSLRLELQDEATRKELESLVSDLLEEFKINYITRSRETDPTETMEEVEHINYLQDSTLRSQKE